MLKWEIKENASSTYSKSVDYGNVFYSQLIGALKKRKWSKTGTVELALYLPKKYIPKLREKFPNCKDVAAFQQKYKAEYAEYFQIASEQNKAAAQRSNPEVCEKYQKLMQKAEAERKELENVSAYYFRTKRLGWINCDRFNQERKTEMALNLGEYEDANVTIVYKEINSIMSHHLLSLESKLSEMDQMHETHISSYETLKNIPVGHDVDLFVVKKMNGKMYCALKQTNTSMKTHGNFDFEELTEERLAKISKKMAGKA